MNTIYALVDENHRPRYIGKTARSLRARLKDHLDKAKAGEKTHKGNWIRAMLSAGAEPAIVVIEQCSNDWPQREMYWIMEGRRIGWMLTNANDGGEGGVSPSLETREKISKAHKGRVRSTETREKISVSRKGKLLSEDHKAAIRKSCAKGFKHTAGAVEKIRASKKGNKYTLGRKATDAQRANVRKAVNSWMSKKVAIRDDKGRVIRWDDR